ncbi:unnamed protein product [Ectocarpus sp. 12 AP-2014]
MDVSETSLVHVSGVGETGTTVQAAEKCGGVVPSFYHPSCAILSSYIVPSLQRVQYGILRTDVLGTGNTRIFVTRFMSQSLVGEPTIKVPSAGSARLLYTFSWSLATMTKGGRSLLC